MAAGRAWRERTARVFLKKNSNLPLLDILCPRHDIGGQDGKRRKRAQKSDGDGGINHPVFNGLSQKELLDRKAIVKAFKDAQSKELHSIKDHR